MPGRDQQQQQQNPFEQMQNRPIYISGKVLMDDGTPAPVGVVIERICGMQPRPEGYTDSKGRFSFQLGQNQHMMADASMGSLSEGPFGGGGQAGGMGRMGAGVNERDLAGCEVRANLPGFRSDVVHLAGRRAMDNPDIGTIVLHRMAKVEGFTFSGTSAFAPKDASKAYEKGMNAIKKKKLDEAEQQLRKAVEVYPKYAAAWYDLGTVYQMQKKVAEAKEAYQQSINADAKFVTPYVQLARLAGVEQKWPEVADHTAKVIRLNPYLSGEMYYISAVANFNLKNLDAAEEHAREAVKMDAQHKNPRWDYLLGIVLAQKAKYPEAAETMRAFLKRVPEGPDADQVKKVLGEIEQEMNGAGAAQGAQQAQ
jgi:tetratricopeptide (TPR) repeat protein